MKISTYFNFKKKSFRGNYSRKYGMYYGTAKQLPLCLKDAFAPSLEVPASRCRSQHLAFLSLWSIFVKYCPKNPKMVDI